MSRSRFGTLLLATGMLQIGTLAAAAWAAPPSQADMDYCNRQALASRGSGSSSVAPTPPGRAANPGSMTNASPTTLGSSTYPGSTGSSGSTSGQPGSGARGTMSQDDVNSAPGMAATGQSDPNYRQMYVACLQQRSGR